MKQGVNEENEMKVIQDIVRGFVTGALFLLGLAGWAAWHIWGFGIAYAVAVSKSETWVYIIISFAWSHGFFCNQFLGYGKNGCLKMFFYGFVPGFLEQAVSVVLVIAAMSQANLGLLPKISIVLFFIALLMIVQSLKNLFIIRFLAPSS